MIVAVAVVGVVMVAGVTFGLALFVWESPNRVNLATFWSFVAAVAAVGIVLIGGLFRWMAGARAWRERGINQSGELNKITDQLAEAVHDQWTQAAMERLLLQPKPIPVRWQVSSKPFANPTWAATDSHQFPPLPGIPPIEDGQLREGGLEDLHRVYGGLGSGRLMIVGSPGSGKSGAAVLLVLAALQYREQLSERDRLLVPVPVIFTMHGWDPKEESVQIWLVRQLQRAYPIFPGNRGAVWATELVRTGRISAILDGLDEIPADLRPMALQALSRQALFRVVILARSAEMTAAAQLDLLEGAVAIELREVDSSTAAHYLTRIQRDPAPPAWRELTERLRHAPESPLATALNSPLTLTLVRDTYRRGNDVIELLNFCDTAGPARSREDIEDHLLDRVLPVAYAQHPGEAPTSYMLREAEDALSYIAARMNEENTRDLAWWRISAWTSSVLCLVTTAIVSGLMVGLVVGVIVGLVISFQDGVIFGIAGLFVGALTFGLVLGSRNRPPQRIALPQWRTIIRENFLIIVWAGIIAGGYRGIAAGISVSLAGMIAVILANALSRPGVEDASPLSPLASWQRDRTAGLLVGLVGGLACGLAGGLVFGFSGVLTAPRWAALAIGLMGGTISGLVVGLAGGLMYSQSWSASLSFIQLAMRSNTPIDLMRFLEDARERNILRTVGSIYQFRHARLQDRLAGKMYRSAHSEDQPYSIAPARKNRP